MLQARFYAMLGKLWHWQAVPGMADSAPGPPRAAPKQTSPALLPVCRQVLRRKRSSVLQCRADCSSGSETTALTQCPFTLASLEALYKPGFEHSVWLALINAIMPVASPIAFCSSKLCT